MPLFSALPPLLFFLACAGAVKAACISHDGSFGAVVVAKRQAVTSSGSPKAAASTGSPAARGPMSPSSPPCKAAAAAAAADTSVVAVWKVCDKRYVGRRTLEKTVSTVSFNPHDKNFVAVTGLSRQRKEERKGY